MGRGQNESRDPAALGSFQLDPMAAESCHWMSPLTYSLHCSIVAPFRGYLINSLIFNWLNQKRNYNGDYRYPCRAHMRALQA